MNSKTNIVIHNRRHVYERGEVIEFLADVKNFHPERILNCSLEFKVDGLWEERIDLGELKLISGKLKVELDSAKLKAGGYQLECELHSDIGILDNETFDFVVAPAIDRSRMVMWHWPSTVHYNALEVSEEEAMREVDRLAAHGFTWFQIRGDWAAENPQTAGKIIDYALTQGLEAGLLVPNWFNGCFRMEDLPDDAAILMADGERLNCADPHHPALIARNQRDIEIMMNFFRHYPSCSSAFLNSELEDHLKLSFNPETLLKHEHKLGFSPLKVKHLEKVFDHPADDADYIAPGVIADTDPDNIYARYYYKHGDGWTCTGRSMAEIIKKYRPDITTIADPLRLCSVYGRFDGIDTVSTWTYSNPDPKSMLYIETLRREAAPENKHVMQTITFYNYAGGLIPAGDRKQRGKVISSGPTRFYETAWINFSRSPLGIGCYFSSLLELTIEDGDSFVYAPETREAVRDFSLNIVRKFGGAVRQMTNSPRRIAVLDSHISRTFGRGPRPHTHYANYFIYDFVTLLNMAHLACDVVFEETIEQEGLDKYDILVMPRCDTLPETVYRKIYDFSEKGGITVADQYLRADVPNVIRFDFDFSWRCHVNANAINTGKEFASTEDTAFKKDWPQRDSEGVTAEEDQRRMEELCQQIRERLDPVFSREVDADSPKVLLNRLDCGKAKYLVAVNDHRTYDDRVGEYQAILGKGLPLTTEICWRDISPESVLYEMVSGQRMDVSFEDKICCFTVNIPASGGVIIAAMPGEVGAPAFELPTEIHCNGEKILLRVILSGGAGVIPVQVTISDPSGQENEFSGIYNARDGICDIDFIPALNDHPGEWKICAVSLLNHKMSEANFNISF
jgi:hypothetical protein